MTGNSDREVPQKRFQVVSGTLLVDERHCAIVDGVIVAVRLNGYMPYETLDPPQRAQTMYLTPRE